MKTYLLTEAEAFRQRNLTNWKENTEFWLSAPLRHVPHVAPKAREILLREAMRVGPSFTVVDLGCGNAWLVDLLIDLNVTFRYLGVDFNPSIIAALKLRYANQVPRIDFKVLDVEQELPMDLVGLGDVVVNAFNFFELPNVSRGFANAVEVIRGGGGLFVLHIDPITQLLCVVDDFLELRRELEAFEESGAQLAYDKMIDLQQGPTQRIYKGILYRISDYHKFAINLGLRLEDFDEILHIKDGRPQSYQAVFWRQQST